MAFKSWKFSTSKFFPTEKLCRPITFYKILFLRKIFLSGNGPLYALLESDRSWPQNLVSVIEILGLQHLFLLQATHLRNHTVISVIIIHSRALNQSVIVERVTCRSNILQYWTGTYWTVANCGFFHGFSTLFRCFVNFKHTTNDMAE
jgi:hypothetical protein